SQAGFSSGQDAPLETRDDPPMDRGGRPLMRFRPYDHWVYARILSVRDINGELDRVSDALRPLAKHLAGLPLEARAAPWEGFLCSQSDRDELILALADQDPLGPPPDDAGHDL